MTYQFDVIIEQDAEGYFVASVPALPGCHTQAKSLDVLMERIREAISSSFVRFSTRLSLPLSNASSISASSKSSWFIGVTQILLSGLATGDDSLQKVTKEPQQPSTLHQSPKSRRTAVMGSHSFKG